MRGDTAELATRKRSPGFSGKNRGVTPSVAAPGVTHPSDTTANHTEHSWLPMYFSLYGYADVVIQKVFCRMA